ncbi:hypothetical protein [Oceanicaulis sp.]|uniref:hypothetical protein n=1 Tax=Oceanicaulis sp. TaxID=1924941 RepID=UPI003F71308E
MQYYVEPIGASFDKKARDLLTATLNDRAQQGYELHTVFQVSEPGCLGTAPSSTYLAVYRKQD